MHHTREVNASCYVIRNLSGLTAYHKIFRLNMYNFCFKHFQNNCLFVAVNVFLTSIGARKCILQSVTLQIHFCKSFYVVLSITRISKPHQGLVIRILLG